MRNKTPQKNELDVFMQALEKALNEINTPGPYNTALAVQAAREAVEEYRDKEEN